MTFIVIELQTDENEHTANIVSAYENRNEAESKYHQILTAAAVSDINTHAAVLIDSRGNLEKSEYYLH